MENADLTLPELYINRELSLLEFNCRVLELAKDKKTPLLERLRFLCISSTNLDEFFEIRVAGLRQKIAAGTNQVNSDGYAPAALLKQINEKQVDLVNDQYRVLNDELVPELANENIRSFSTRNWSFGIGANGHTRYAEYRGLFLEATAVSQHQSGVHIKVQKLQIAKRFCTPDPLNLVASIQVMTQTKLLGHFLGTRMNRKNNRQFPGNSRQGFKQISQNLRIIDITRLVQSHGGITAGL